MCQNSKFSLPFFVCFLCVCPGPVDDPSQPVWTNWKRGRNAFTPQDLPPSYLRRSHHLGTRSKQNINSAQQKCHKCQTKYKYFLLIKIIEKGRPSSLGRCWSRCCIYNWCFKLFLHVFQHTGSHPPSLQKPFSLPLSLADQLYCYILLYSYCSLFCWSAIASFARVLRWIGEISSFARLQLDAWFPILANVNCFCPAMQDIGKLGLNKYLKVFIKACSRWPAD